MRLLRTIHEKRIKMFKQQIAPPALAGVGMREGCAIWWGSALGGVDREKFEKMLKIQTSVVGGH